LIVAPIPLTAALLVLRRRYLIVMTRELTEAARCASQVLGHGAHAAARGAATLPQQEKSNSADVQWNTVNIAGFICTEAS
jgi:hypothetical protein